MSRAITQSGFKPQKQVNKTARKKSPKVTFTSEKPFNDLKLDRLTLQRGAFSKNVLHWKVKLYITTYNSLMRLYNQLLILNINNTVLFCVDLVLFGFCLPVFFVIVI